jgi:aminoglycoside phosphotransferase (APT) family kinase protein
VSVRGQSAASVSAVELLASGREAQVYALDEHRVLRRFRDPGRSAAAAAALLTRLADAGYPVPWVDSADGPDLVMERVHGPRMTEALTAGTMTLEDAARMLAGLLDRLHALPGDQVLLHLDLHPENVLIGTDGPVVIDWSNARPGPPGLDVAMSGLIVTQVAVAQPAYAESLGTFVRTLVGAVADDPLPHVDDAVALRRSDPHMTSHELAQMNDAAELLRSLC